jgi:hypothetical protein
LRRIADWCRRHLHEPIRKQYQALKQKLLGHFQYFGVVGNGRSLWCFRERVQEVWKKWLARRCRGGGMTWELCRRRGGGMSWRDDVGGGYPPPRPGGIVTMDDLFRVLTRELLSLMQAIKPEMETK